MFLKSNSILFSTLPYLSETTLTVGMHVSDNILNAYVEKNRKHLTVLCPGIILETEANFKLLSPLLEIQIKDVSSCNLNGRKQFISAEICLLDKQKNYEKPSKM